MKIDRRIQPRPLGFTLIELLVVIGIIALLAAMIFPAAAIVKGKAARNKARAELAQVASAIDSYQAKYGHYPPDNPGKALNQLYYELIGTKKTKVGSDSRYETLDARTNILESQFPSSLPGVSGFVNCTQSGGDDITSAQNFIPALTPSRYSYTANGVGFLITSVAWPAKLGALIPGAAPEANPIRYVATGPTNNPKSYDLWVDVVISGKTNRINNWTDQPEIVGN